MAVKQIKYFFLTFVLGQKFRSKWHNSEIIFGLKQIVTNLRLVFVFWLTLLLALEINTFQARQEQEENVLNLYLFACMYVCMLVRFHSFKCFFALAVVGGNAFGVTLIDVFS